MNIRTTFRCHIVLCATFFFGLSISTFSQPATSRAPATESKQAKKQTGAEKAGAVLDQAYQMALNAKPVVKAQALAQIAETMKGVDKSKASSYYHTAFESTVEIPLDEKQINRGATQSRLAVGLADINAEAAMELATRVDAPPPTKEQGFMTPFARGSQNFRAQAIQQVAMKLAEKDLSRAMILILPTLRERDFPYDAILPLAGKLRKEAPDKAETLFNELLQQFNVSAPTFNQMVLFPVLIRVFADLNRALTLQAIDAVLAKIPAFQDDLSKSMQESAEESGHLVAAMPFDMGAIPKAMVISMLKKIDPDRAAALEKEVAPTMDALDKQTGGMVSRSILSMDFDPSESMEKQQDKMLNSIDPGKMPESQRGPFSNVLALSLARSNPERAMDFTKHITADRDKALALAAIAGGYVTKDKDKARGLLGEAGTLAEKVKNMEDRAVIYTMMAETAARLDRELAKSFYNTAFESYAQAFDEYQQAVSSEKERNANENKAKELARRYSRAVASYANIDFDDAV